MTKAPNAAGVDGAPDGWAVVTMKANQLIVERANALSDILDGSIDYRIIAVDVPIGLLDTYEIGGRVCDRAARKLLGRPRGSSVFPAPVRAVLGATSWSDACVRSRASGPDGKALSKQTYEILRKIEEIDALLQSRPELRDVVREVHPEVCFCELTGNPMAYRKTSVSGRDERRHALARAFPELPMIEKSGRDRRIAIEDILDAAVAYWSALRLTADNGRSLPVVVPVDSTGLPMAIWV